MRLANDACEDMALDAARLLLIIFEALSVGEQRIEQSILDVQIKEQRGR